MPIHGHQLHPGPDTSLRRGHSFDGVDDLSALIQQEPNRVFRVDLLDLADARFYQFRRSLVINQFPAASLDAGEGGAGAVVSKPFGPESAPVVRNNLIQRRDYVIEGVGLDFRWATLAA